MPRALVLLAGLILIAAGCGGGYAGAVRQEAKQWFGDGNPKILRIETVRDLGGNKQIVATLQGDFKLSSHCAWPHTCRPGPRFHYAWLSFSEPKGMGGESPTSASRIAAIDNAHRARPVFSIFPDTLEVQAIRCAIPKGNSSGTIAGSCSTAVADGTFDHPREIRFHEAWFFASLGDIPHQKAGGGWIVSLDRAGHVQSIRRFGDLPPQLWK